VSSELSVGYSFSKNIYAIVRRRSNGNVWDVGDSALEAAGTWNNARIGECDIALTDKGGGYYTGDFPTACTTAATYDIMYYDRAGASPAITDRLIGRSTVVWNGTAATTTPASGSGTTLANLKNMCYFHGWQSKDDAGESALTRFINNTIRMLTTLAPWPEYHKRDGRITLATATAAYTMTDDGDSNIGNIGQVGDIIRTNRTTPLTEMAGGINEWLFRTKTVTRTGWPEEYAMRPYVSSGLILKELLVDPKPTSAENGDYLYFTYFLLPAELAESTDETDWPNYRLWLLEEALDKRNAAAKRDSLGVALQTSEFTALINKAMKDARPSYIPLRASIVTDYRNRNIKEIWPIITS